MATQIGAGQTVMIGEQSSYDDDGVSRYTMPFDRWYRNGSFCRHRASLPSNSADSERVESSSPRTSDLSLRRAGERCARFSRLAAPPAMCRRVCALLFTLAFGLAAGPAGAQSPGSPDRFSAPSAASALQDAKEAHLWRVAAWGGANALGGLALVWGAGRSQRSAAWHFGAMTAGWGAVNVGIAAIGLSTASPPAPTMQTVLGAERQFHDILLFNLGLNVAYSAVGATMLGAGYRDVSSAARWRGFGTSLIVQGIGLLVLDGVAFFASRARLTSLLDAGVTLSLQPLPAGATLALQF